MANGVEITGDVEDSVIVNGEGNLVIQGNVTIVQPAQPTAAASIPNYAFDRQPQKDALQALLTKTGASIVPLFGASGEGQALVGEFIFQELRRKGGLRRRVRVRSDEWPRCAELEQRLNELCECVARDWSRPSPAAAHDPEGLVNLLKAAAKREGSQPVIVHHAILVPKHDDLQLIEVYLENVWKRVLKQAELPARPLLVFELNLARRGSWQRRALRWLRLGDEGATQAILKLLRRFARDNQLSFTQTPELLPLTSAELSELYPRSGAADPVKLRALALDVHRATSGHFDDVVRQLFPQGAQ